jgi:hypothetical protein
MQLTKQDYYALVRYRGKDSYFKVSAKYNEGIWVEYIDCSYIREWDGVWIKNGEQRIIEKYSKGTPHYKYFSSLERRFYKLCLGVDGTDNIIAAYRRAVKETPNPLNITINKNILTISCEYNNIHISSTNRTCGGFFNPFINT